MSAKTELLPASYEIDKALLYTVGLRVFTRLLRQRHEVHFSEWAAAVMPSCQATEPEIRRVWDFIEADPVLAPFSDSFTSWKAELRANPVEVLPAGSLVGFHRSPIRDLSGRLNPNRYLDELQFVARLKEALKMKPGKKHYECCPVEVEIILQKSVLPEFAGVSMAAKTLRLPEKRLLDEGDVLRIKAESLNQSMTVARYLLRPDLTDTGGNIYHYALWLGRKHYIALESIRADVEVGKWRVPTSADLPDPGTVHVHGGNV
jgi:hypothetical protein